jgi:hypothetical protein
MKKGGADTAQAFIDGMDSKGSVIKNWLIQQIHDAFPELKVPAGVKVPSKPKQPASTRNPAGVGGTTLTKPTHTQTVTNNYNYYAGDGKTMSPAAYFNKMHFKQRNMRRC